MSRQASRSGRQTPVGGFGAKPRAARGFGAFGLSSSGSELSYLAEPPDFSAISDAQAVVSYKNLLKKDSVTKARALEELLSYVKAHPFEREGGPEEAIIEAWVKVYPAASIDNSRRVRELAQSLQYEFMKAGRKRMERQIPKIVGPWLAGLYDRDRLVARVANDGLSSFLNSPEKVAMLWNKCQQQILQFALGAIRETKDSLSDERSTTPEDAEAKYFRVLGAALSLVLGLLQKLGSDDTLKFEDSYAEFLNEDVVWKCINAGDSSVRKSACQLLQVCLQQKKAVLEDKMARLKKVLISEGLKANHTGSAAAFTKALHSFTEAFPAVWESSAGDKKTPVSRLNHFVEKGSQGSEVKYWEHLQALLQRIPAQLISLDAAISLAKSMRSGISSREEPRSNAALAWGCYLQTSRTFMSRFPVVSDQVTFAKDALFPLVEHYLHPAATGASVWTIPASSAPIIVEGCYAITTESAPAAVSSAAEERWMQLGQDFCSRITNSLPEVSREFQKSQDLIAEEGRRWFSLIGQIQKTKAKSSPSSTETALDPAAVEIFSCCVDVLSKRNLKPFGAAKTIYYMGDLTAYLESNKSVSDKLYTFLLHIGKEQLDLVLRSQARLDLLASVQLYAKAPSLQQKYESLWDIWSSQLLQISPSSVASPSLAVLIANEKAASFSRRKDEVQKYIIGTTLQSLGNTTDNFHLLESSLRYGALTLESVKAITVGIMEHLHNGDSGLEKALSGLDILSRQGASLLSEDDDLYLSLVTQLLSLAETPESIVSSKARELHQLLDRQKDGKKPTSSIVRINLDGADHQSLEIDTVVQLAARDLSSNPQNLPELLPKPDIWRDDLIKLTLGGVNPSLSITSLLGGAQFLVKASSAEQVSPVARDRNGYSASARMGLYLLKLLEDGVELESLPTATALELLLLLLVTVEIGSEQLTMMEPDGLFELMSPAVQTIIDKFVSSTRKWLNTLISESAGWKEREAGGASVPLIFGILQALLDRSKGNSPVSFYHAKAAAEIFQAFTEEHGPPDNFGNLLEATYPPKETPSSIFPVVALLRGVGQSMSSPDELSTICNRLVSDVAGAKPTSEKALASLVLLTCCLAFYEEGEVPVQMNRLVFAAKNVTGWFEAEGPVDPFFAAESCRLLTRLLPELASVYGSHWENTLEYCTRIWATAGEYPLDVSLSAIHASLKLYSTLEALPEPNDDLEDSLKESAELKAKSLLDLLKLPREYSSQPLSIVDSFLCRQVVKIPMRFVKDLSELYGLLACESRDIQTAIFTLLHRALPKLQEQLSVDVLLDKESANIPDEMISLLLEPPTLEKYPDDVLSQFPLPVRAYLLTWHLIFDSYSTASLAVRNDYTEDIKAGNYMSPLLDFIFDVLGHSAAHPISLDKQGLTSEHIRAYDIKTADSESDERDMQWLLVHIYYLCLKYTPELFRVWFINCRSKQTRIAVEGWMTKYYSPLIVLDALDDVARWAEAQEAPSDDEKELLVKVSRTAREVTAGYEVDEDMAAITIKVPPNYPIEGITVIGTSRVVVNEKKWQSWVRTTQGVITFSNGSIIDGLMTFRRNIVGALKGQTECAICYAIISTDKKMPDKRCQTCKNLFHRTCLYKWFQTSSQNTCPLCRNPIDYLGSDSRARRP